MFDRKTCPLYKKLSRGGSLSKLEKKLLADIVREEESDLVNIKIDLKHTTQILSDVITNSGSLGWG